MTFLAAVCAVSALGFQVEQVFRTERFARGNELLRPVQEIDSAAWCRFDGTNPASDEAVFVRYRCDFAAQDVPLVLDVSADARFVLLLDGREIARGPHAGCVQHWYYETYEVRGLEPGGHCLEAVVYDLGSKGPPSLMTAGESGLIVKAAGRYDALLTTGKAPWLAGRLTNVTFASRTDPLVKTGCECISRGTGFLDAMPTAWRPVVCAAGPVVNREYGTYKPGRFLFPTERADQLCVEKSPGRICAVQDEYGATNRWYAPADAEHPLLARLEALRKKGTPVTVPPRTRIRLLWDLADYYCAYPILETSGGNGARVRWGWTESLYDRDGDRADRSAFVGKRVACQMYDTFLPDGRAHARFTLPWWRSGRWAEVSVMTDDEPLVLTRLSLAESRYPFSSEATFECDDQTIADIRRICLRGLQNCLHETLMDCPYFEQQMYPGDSRVEMLVMSALNGDSRMHRSCIGIFDYGRCDNGLVRMNFPSRNIQESSTYSMCWAMMCGDYALWHGADAFLRARLPGMRQTMHVLRNYRNSDGLLEGLPGWNFQDWVPEWDRWGNAPDGRLGLSSVNNLLYAYALRRVAIAEDAAGEPMLADYWRKCADDLAVAVRRRFWDEDRGLLADDMAKTRFSEHAQCLALLADVLDPPTSREVFEKLVTEKDLARCTVYFSHYLFETCFRFGRSDIFLRKLDLWRDFVKLGLSTPVEAPGARARSDCHAWGSHPLYHLQAGVAGIRPDAVGFERVKVAPQPGGLKFVRASCPTPKGVVSEDLRFTGERVSGEVTLPKGLPGVFTWRGVDHPLKPGVNEISY